MAEEIKRTKEEAVEVARREIFEIIEDGETVGLYKENEKSITFRNTDSGLEHNIGFTPPIPEFKKGTVGVGEGGELCYYKKKFDEGDYLLTHHKDRIHDEEGMVQGFRSDTFTPIYQNDPILERAIQLIAKALKDGVVNSRTEQESIDFYLSQAKKELSK